MSRLGSRREIVAWCLYDWANSAYSTLAITVLVAYFLRFVFPPDTWEETGSLVWAYGIGGSTLLGALLSPVLGALADAQASKRWWLAGTAWSGSLGAFCMALVPTEQVWVITGLFVFTNLCFELSFCFYNGFLPEISDEARMNQVSSWGYGAGYLGGGLALIIAIVLISQGERLGLSDPVTRIRASLGIMGLWWGLFSIPTIMFLKDRSHGARQSLGLARATRLAARDVAGTILNLRRYGVLVLFLVSFLFYNEGVQTVISQASVFAIRALRFSEQELSLVILMIQFLAFPGALLVSWLADRFGQKPTLLVCLAIWAGVLLVAYSIETKAAFWGLGVVVALVLGGTQSVSRAIMGVLTPAQHTGKFFGFFNLSGKATSFLGPFLFGTIMQATHGDARLAIISLLLFFVLGSILVSRLNLRRGREERIREETAAGL